MKSFPADTPVFHGRTIRTGSGNCSHPAISRGTTRLKVIATYNIKGGVGKAATAVNLAAALSIAEKPTLLIDSDPQANSTRALGFDDDPERASLYDVLTGAATLDEVRMPVEELPSLSLIPSDRNLIGAEVELVGAEGREYRLKNMLEAYERPFETALIDCPPSLGLLTVNALVGGWFHLSDNGTLVYQPGGVQGTNRRMAFVDAEGRASPWSQDRRSFDGKFAISPDGRRLAIAQSDADGISEIWVSDIDGPRLERLDAESLAHWHRATQPRWRRGVRELRAGRDPSGCTLPHGSTKHAADFV